MPTYCPKETPSKFAEFFKQSVFPQLDSTDYSKRGFAHTFEQLVLVHSYVHTMFETINQDDFEGSVQACLPPLFNLDNILRRCTDVAKIKEACTKESDLQTALTFSRLASLQALKLLWF